MSHRTAFAASALALFQCANAQLTGPYTVGGVGANYPAISAAFADAVAQGVSGPVEFLVNNGTYTDNWNVDMAAIAGLSATNTITLRSVGNDSSLVTVQSAVPAVDITHWAFSNMRHLRVQDITWVDTGAPNSIHFRAEGDMIDVRFERNHFITWPGGNSYPIQAPFGPVSDVVVEQNTFENAENSLVLSTILGNKGSHNVRVRHNHFTGGWSTVSLGWTIGLEIDSNYFHDAISPISVYKCDSVSVRWNQLELSGTAMVILGTDTTSANNCTDVLVAENHINGIGIDVSGVAIHNAVRPMVLNNTMHSTGGYGVSLVYVDDPVVRENVIDSAYFIGMELYNFSGSALVEDNTVMMDTASFYNQGLVIDTQLEPGSVVHITGNRLHSVDSGLGIELINLVGDATNRALVANNEVMGFTNAAEFESTSSDIVFNSFLCGASSTFPLSLELGTDLLFANNVVSVPMGAPATYVIFEGSTAPDLHNNIYQYDYTTLWLNGLHVDLASANADGQELGSLLLDPEFIDPTIALQPGNATMLGTGAPVAPVSTDILGFTRNPASPTPGAYEDIALSIASTVPQANALRAWPAPFDDMVHVETTMAGPVQIEILSADGRCVQRTGTADHSTTITGLRELAPGIYTLRCSNGVQICATPCIKQ